MKRFFIGLVYGLLLIGAMSVGTAFWMKIFRAAFREPASCHCNRP